MAARPVIEVMDPRHQMRHDGSLGLQGLLLEVGPVKRQRPTLANQPHIGQRLLDANARPPAL